MTTKLEGQEQCTCGIVFDAPMHGDPDFMEHVMNGTHKASLLIEVCGPCFMGFCKGCDGTRRSDVQRWRCRCMHDFPIIFNDSIISEDHMRRTWSEWLLAGRNSSVQQGTEYPAMDSTNPIKENRHGY